jgi:hypothetical protein
VAPPMKYATMGYQNLSAVAELIRMF